MRTLTLEIEPFETVKEEMAETFTIVRSYSILETLKMDYQEGICIEILEFTLNEGVSIHDIKTIGNMEVLSVLKSIDNKHTCLIRYTESEEAKEQFQESDLGLIHTVPTIISPEKFTISMMGERKNLSDFVEMMRNAGTIRRMSFRRAAYQKADILAVLTGKQREVMIAAFQNGYYDFPKKISSKQLCQKVSVSKPTLLQHMRKAEGRILREIMTGYFQSPD
ncbi:MAG TPA: helix-turn-helix domain-containing protein [Methanomassiliicoccales archaeon]|nr:helix-turn-helix domain-containing protein [Methanomassiliicoccales archaeon]